MPESEQDAQAVWPLDAEIALVDARADGSELELDTAVGDAGELDASEEDAGDGDAPVEAGPPDGGEIALPDVGPTPSDAETDASDADASDGDAGADGMAPRPARCASDDLTRWRSFHLSGHAVSTIQSCVAADPLCATGACAIDACLMDTFEVATCDECVADEVSCMFERCRAACGRGDSDERCRACACAQGCVAEFDACAGGALDVCADCRGDNCSATSLAPELIMVVVAPLLR